jgi:ParB family transcriptional regulator, chromosome partitioning protein
MEESPFYGNSVFFIEVDKIRPNPYQPRRDFDESKLNELAESIRVYGVLQPIVVTRKEFEREDGGLGVEYELIAGERRHRASKIAGLREIPALIRAKEDDNRVKLELAIIENLQREDISPVDKARAFKQLSEEFGLKHSEIANKVGKSREYVSNAIRLLALPEEMLIALGEGKITEGHTRPLLMLIHKPEEQNTLFKEIMLRRLTVRDAESISRKIAIEKVRKPDKLADPEIVEWEQEVGSALGTRVHVEKKEQGGRIHIDYFNEEDLKKIMAVISAEKIAQEEKVEIPPIEPSMNTIESTTPLVEVVESESSNEPLTFAQEIEVPKIEEDNEDIYSVRNFNI